MDARRLDLPLALPHALLAAAAPAYLTDAEWDAVGEDWLEQALAYASAPCKGVRGPLARIRPRFASSRSRESDSLGRGATAPYVDGPVYRLADYLDQFGRRHRREHIPPSGFWTALSTSAHLGDLVALGDAASRFGLFRDAAQLYKQAVAHAGSYAAYPLITLLHDLYPDDQRPAQWVVQHTATDDPGDLASLLRTLRQAGAQDQISVLADRAARRAALKDPHGVAWLLRILREIEAKDQVSVLLAREPARHAALHELRGVAHLLTALWEAGAQDQFGVLADRATGHTAPDAWYGLSFPPFSGRLT